jgi:hypothetical protein
MRVDEIAEGTLVPPRRGLLRGKTVDSCSHPSLLRASFTVPRPRGRGERREKEREREREEAKAEAEISARNRAIIAVEEAQSKGLA